jgi:hypothetical protein
MNVANWSAEDFRNTMGTIYLVREHKCECDTADSTAYGGTGQLEDGSHVIVMFDAAFTQTGRKEARRTFVHELAHVWDSRQGGALSRGMEKETGGKTSGGVYTPGGKPASSYARNSREEDWAEAVAASVYPYYARYRGGMDNIRRDYVQDKFDSVIK